MKQRKISSTQEAQLSTACIKSPNVKKCTNPHFGLAVVVCLLFLSGLHSLLSQHVPKQGMTMALLCGMAGLGLKLLRFRRWADENAHVGRFVCCFLLMLLELSIENGCVWLVSALDNRKYELTPGLQDNVELLALALGRRSRLLQRIIHTPWANILHFLMALLALCFSPLWDQVPYSGFGIASRFVLTIAASRCLRVLCFMSTVLPSPRPGCYARRFPPPPDTAWGMLKAGYTTIRGFGGCNDLVFSGHGAFWVLAPLVFRTYYTGHVYAYATEAVLWAALAQASLRDVVDRQHYSVDMILAVVVTWACWTWTDSVYPAAKQLKPRKLGAAADRLSPFVAIVIVAALAAAAVIVIGGKA